MSEIQSELVSRRIDTFDRNHTLHVRRRYRRHDSLHAEIDDFVCALSIPSQLTFSGLGDKWHETTKCNAQSTLCYMLSNDLAFNSLEIPNDDAEALTNEFLALFETNARFFTNGQFDFDSAGWSGWGRVTDATFETGIVVVDEVHIGILWCHDED
ncbi:MAG: hypothetical protein AAF750_14630 [Planctomycetota bacterium]